MHRRWRWFLVLVLLMAAVLVLRLWRLNTLPASLWFDEASQGLDARDLLQGHFRAFFWRAQGKEPLYIYLTTPFVAAFDGQPFAVRIAAALIGAAMVPALFAAGRALWRNRPGAGGWVGIFAAGLWAFNFWPQSINRIGFQVNAMPLMLTLAVVAWLNWTHRPDRRRALIFGLLSGSTLLTYLGARITPFLWAGLYLALPARTRRALLRDLPWAVLAFGLVVAPMVVHLALHPDETLRRIGDFANIYVGPASEDRLRSWLVNTLEVGSAFLGLAGDPIARHNIPYRPPFSPPVAILFALGALLAVPGIFRRSQRSWTLLLWIVVLSIPAVLAGNSNPHFPRLLGVLPAAFLLAAWPVGWVCSQLKTSFSRRPGVMTALGAALMGTLLLFEAANMIPAYFVTWARDSNVTASFQGEIPEMVEAIVSRPGAVGLAPMDPSSAYVLDYAYAKTPIRHLAVNPTKVEAWLDAALSGTSGRQVLTPRWKIDPYTLADTQHAIPFYLEREGKLVGEDESEAFTMLAYELGQRVQFTAPGQAAAVNARLGSDLTLAHAQWGAAYPNPERNSQTVAAGTPVWVILEWQYHQLTSGIRVAVDLVDDDGQRLVTLEQPLFPDNVPSDFWSREASLRTYHLVKVPPAQPPGEIELRARAYATESGEPLLFNAEGAGRTDWPLGSVQVVQPAAPVEGSQVVVPTPIAAPLGPNARLLGRDTLPETVMPGDRLSLRLYWQAIAPLEADLAATVSLADTGVRAVQDLPADVTPGYPTQAYFQLRIPADQPPGDYPLLLTGSGIDAPVELGTLTVTGQAAVYEPPELAQPLQVRFDDAVAVLGIAEPDTVLTVEPGGFITTTLVWRALSTPSSELVRFLHVLGPDGQPVAQRDSTPCDPACPAPSWRPDQVLTDTVRVEIPTTAQPGEYPTGVGWFDPATGQRLSVYDAGGQRLENDLAPLPLRVRITAPTETQ